MGLFSVLQISACEFEAKTFYTFYLYIFKKITDKLSATSSLSVLVKCNL